MALYALGDPHLSLASEKPMDVFGGRWENYVEKLREGLSVLREEDVLVLCGDLSWAMSLEEAAADFRFLDAFPGRKLLVKGNHDYWWNTASKMTAFFEREGLRSFALLHNNCHFYGELALCGTRGWFYEEEGHGAEHDKKIMNRELLRLEVSLKAAGEREKLVFLHYPPLYGAYRCEELLALLRLYGVKRCFYGHIHGPGRRLAVEGEREGTVFKLVSADHIDFKPWQIL